MGVPRFFFVLALAAYATVQRVIVHGRSMEPTLHDGDALIAWKLMPHDVLHPGDVIVFLQNASGTLPPPQFVQIPGGVRPWRMLFLEYNSDVKRGRLPKPDSEDTIYVMGDNTDNSEDSRVFGPIRQTQVVGRVYVKDLALQ